MSESYYFVPLGREPGGLLDFLGLPPGARQDEVKTKLTQYRQTIAADLAGKTARLNVKLIASDLQRNQITQKDFDYTLKRIRGGLLKEYKVALEHKEISQEAFDAKKRDAEAEIEELIAAAQRSPVTREEVEAQEKRWQAEQNDLLTHVNDLNKSYESRLTHQRDLLQRGLADDSVSWLEPFGSFPSREEFWRLALARRPLAQQPAAAQSPPANPKATARVDSLAALRDLVESRDRQYLEWTDLLWTSEPGTNRALWHAKVLAWIAELAKLGPALDLHRSGTSKPVTPEFPVLAEPTPLAINRLARDEVEEVEHGPRRSKPESSLDPAALLAELLGRAVRARPGPGPQGGGQTAQPGAQLSFDEFVRLMQLLDAAVGLRPVAEPDPTERPLAEPKPTGRPLVGPDRTKR